MGRGVFVAENQPKAFVDSIHDARKGMSLELSAQAEQIQKLARELTELQTRHERTEREASHRWEELASAAAATTAAYESRVTSEEALETVLGAVRGLMTATLPEQVFQTLTEEAAQFGVRAAIFDVRGKAAWGASSHGFGSGLTEKVLRSLIIQLNQDNPFRQVCETAGDVEVTTETLKKHRNLLDRFKPAPHAPILLLPVRSAGAVTAIFYADPGDTGKSLPVSALKILSEFAGAQIDRLIALGSGFADEDATADAVDVMESQIPAEVKLAEVSAAQSAPAEAHDAEAAAAEPHKEESAVELHPIEEQVTDAPAAGHPAEIDVPAVLAADEPVAEVAAESPVEIKAEATALAIASPSDLPQGSTEGDVEQPAPSEAAQIELLPTSVEHEAEPVPMVAVGTEDGFVSPVDQPVVAAFSSLEPIAASTAVDLPAPMVPAEFDVAQLSEGEQKTHKDAKRFAKLLVSEIELYNKSKVADGRRNQDLYKRLKTDIDRSRLTFEKRFGKSLSKQVDYFNDEMVKILAANDPAVLGPEYPGPAA